MLLRRLLLGLGIAALPACIEVQFPSDGGGGAGATGGDTGAGAVGGTGGQGGVCVPNCDADHRCGPDGCGSLCNDRDMPATLAVDLDEPTNHLTLYPKTESAIVASDAATLYRVDLCDGSVMGDQKFDFGDHIRGLARIGTTLVVPLIEERAPVGSGVWDTRIYFLDARTLEILGDYTELLDFAVWDSVVDASATGLWLGGQGSTTDSPALVHVGLDGATCAAPPITGAAGRRGITLLGGQPLLVVDVPNAQDPEMDFNLATIACTGCPCGGSWMLSGDLANNFTPYSLVSDGASVAAVGFVTMPDFSLPFAKVATVTATLGLSATADIDPHPAGSKKPVDALGHGAILGSNLYAVGLQGESNPLVGDGASLLVRWPLAGGQPDLASLRGAVWTIRAETDGDALYFTGRWDAEPANPMASEVPRGYLVKCGIDLDCPEIGGPRPTVSCGGVGCPPGQICCSNTDTCGEPASCAGPTLACDGPHDCLGEECCGDSSVSLTSSVCRPSCNAGEVELCNGDAAVCDPGQTCTMLGEPRYSGCI